MRLISKKSKIFILTCLVVVLSAIFGVVFSNAAEGDAASIQGSLTSGRKFASSDKLELQRDLESMPKTYEAVVYVPEDKKTMGVIFGNYIRETRSCFTFRISADGQPQLQIIDKDINTVLNTFDYDIRGEEWVHVAITHEVLDDGALFSCYINGELVGTNKTDISYELDMDVAQSAVTPYIGMDFRNEYYFKGRIKNLALYTEALSAAEIAASFNNGVGSHTEDMLACYDLTDAEGSKNISDLTGNGYDFAPQYFVREEPKTDFAYSFAVVGDTQYLVYKDAHSGTSYTSYIYDWIVGNKDAKNIKFVMGLGDITDKNGVDNSNDSVDQTDKEWTLAVAEHQKLTNAGIPYTVIRGNHDTVPQLDKYFEGNSNFSAMDAEYFEGTSLGNYFVRFTVGETKYMILCLDYCLEAGSDEMLWANTAIEQNPDCKVIITTHYHVNYDGSRSGDIWDSLVTHNKNVIMVVSGHVGKTANTAKSYSVGAAGHTVLELLVDPQYLDTNYVYKNVGMVGMFYFSADGKEVDFEYISTQKTLTDQSEDVFYGRKNQFSFTIPDEPKLVTTKYGVITDPTWADSSTYPFVVFNEKGECIGAATYFYGSGKSDSAIGQVKTYLSGNNWSDGVGVEPVRSATILMRADHALGKQYYDNISQIEGLVTIDLNGYTLSAQTGTAKDAVMIRCKHKTTGYPTELVFKNGTLDLYNNPVLRLYGNVEGKKMKFSFENVDFTLSGASSYLMAKYDATTEYDIYPEINLTDCVIDLSGYTGTGIALFDVGSEKAHSTITVKGGSIITGGKAFTILEKTNDATQGKLIFEEYNGAYTTLTLPEGTALPSEVLSNGTDNLVFANYVTENGNDIYRLTYEYVDTKYGRIPAKFTFTDKYPFVVFDENGNCINDSKTFEFYPIVNLAKNYLKYNFYNGTSYSYNGGAPRTAVILMRRDYAIGTNASYDNISQVRGTITIDLDGYTLTRSGAESLMRSTMKQWADTSSGDGKVIFPTELIFKNGSIDMKNGPLAKWSVNSTGAGKQMAYGFIDINFTVTGTASEFAATHAGTNAFGNSCEMYFENCVIDITGAGTQSIVLFDLGDETTFLSVYMKGCEIKAKNNEFVLAKKSDEISTGVLIISDSDSVYNTLTLPAGYSAPEHEGVEFIKISETADTVTYRFKTFEQPEDINTKYGVVPYEYRDSVLYPIVVFDEKGNLIAAEQFLFARSGSYNSEGAIHQAKTYLTSNKDCWDGQSSDYNESAKAVYILLRGDYVMVAGEKYDNMAQIRGHITIDLDGHTITTPNNKEMFTSTIKPWSKNIAPTYLHIINGNINLLSHSIARFNAWTADNVDVSTKVFKYTFENINFKVSNAVDSVLTIYGQHSSTPTAIGNPEMSFENCVFDLTDAKEGVTFFDLGNGYVDATITVIGCEIIIGSSEVALVTESNISDGATTNDGSVRFEKAEGGNYMSITVPKGTQLPAADFDGFVFVKVYETETTETYRLRVEEVANIDFVPKMSITLDSNLTMNVYVPANNSLQSFVFNGVNYDAANLGALKTETVDGKIYYVFSIPLPAAEAAKVITLVANISVGENVAKATFTFSIPKYAAKVLANGTDVEKTLAKDVLAYVKAAYNYFTEFNTAEEIARVNTLIDSIIGDYKAEPVSSGVTNTVSPVTSVTLNLDSKPSIRFYVTDTNLEFYANGRKLDTVTGTDATYGAYVELDVYAYVLAETITYGNGGSYHISSFVKGSAGTAHEALVKAFVKYTESAAAYRESVIN